MKRGTPDHPKLLRLARRLGISPPHAGGILEFLWHWTARFAPAGDIGRFSDQDISGGIRHDGDATALIGALVAEGWLEEHRDHRLVVHAWREHCDEAVHMSLARACKLFADGTEPRRSRLNKDERERADAAFKIRAHGRRTACARRAHGLRTSFPPSLSPALVSEEEPEVPEAPPAMPKKRANGSAPEVPSEAASFASDFRNALAKIHPTAKPPTPGAFEAWGQAARLMLTADKRPIAEARAIAEWLFADSGGDAAFWRANILSVGKFRQQYDQLAAHKARGTAKEKRGPHQQSSLLAWANR